MDSMDRKVNVLGAEDFKTTGRFFYCTCDEIKDLSKSAISDWFGEAKKIILENGKEYAIMSIGAMRSFSDIGSALIEVEAKDIPSEIYPTTAMIR